MENFFTGIGSSFVAVFLSEIGDKTFVVIALLSQKQSITAILLGYLSALMPLIVLAAYIGKAATFMPQIYLNCLSSACFLIFSILSFINTLKEYKKSKSKDKENDSDEDESKLVPLLQSLSWFKAFTKTCALIFIAE